MSMYTGLVRVLASHPCRIGANHFTEKPKLAKRRFSTTKQQNFKVCVIGGAGGIGQPLSLLLKLNPMVTRIALYDIVPSIPGVAKDLSHIDTNCVVEGGFIGPETLGQALKCSNIVVIPAGMPRKPGMARADLFTKNACVVQDSAKAIAEFCPDALVAIITNPVNTVVPIACEVLKKANAFNPNKVFGVTALDAVRTRTFAAEILKIDPCKVQVNVICGHSGNTIVPLLSSCKPALKIDHEAIVKLTTRIQNAGTEVVKAKAGAGSATVSMAHAAAKFVNSLLRGLSGDAHVIDSAYVKSNVCDAEYFAAPLHFGKEGVCKHFGVPDMDDYEKEIFKKAVTELKGDIKKGVDFVNTK